MKKIVSILSILSFSIIMLNAQIKKITSTEVDAMLKKEHNFIVLDVRTADEFKAGHIKGAINIDIRQGDALAKIDRLDRKAKYIVYCRTSNRSKTAVDHMAAKGFMNVYHMIDGFVGWSQNELP
jgi:rhodanese-related sulfurtransferase